MKLRILVYICAFALLIFLWQYCGDAFFKVRILISTPKLIVLYFKTNGYYLLKATYITLFESILGLIVAIAFSFGTMVICLIYPKILRFVVPLFVSSQVIPVIAIAPLLIMVFGLGIDGKVVMAALMCYFPLFINFLSGINLISPNIKDMIFIYNSSKKFNILKVAFPLSLPYIFTGLKISGTLSVIGSIVAEFNGADYGIGKNLFLSAKRLEPELLMCSLIVSVLLGTMMYGLVWFIERKMGKWYLS